ncbi:MAG: DegT/DnrJ/EryC1/StrS family aminotransferase [Anaerolineales bacterium]|jgi:dTDP-4-amino-4,6-dideoxygalactose transaminase
MIYISKPVIGDEEKAAVLQVLESGMLAQGARTAELEQAFAEICGAQHAIATSSGTTALQVALTAHGIGEGDEVVTTPFTFIASVNSILYTGATPVFADIQEDSFNIDPELVEKAVSPRTKAIMPVHLYGYPCDMQELMQIAERHNLVIIEDAAQAVGAEYRGQRVGSFGTGCFSLYATKNVMSGEGGIITTNDEELAQRCRMIRNHGMKRRYYHDALGYNYRISDLHAALGVVQCKKLEALTEARRRNAAAYNNRLKTVITPKVKDDRTHVWHQYTIRVSEGRDRDAAVKQLNDAGVGTGIFYPVPAHKQAYLAEMGLGEVHLPVAEQLAHEVISIPVHPQVSEEDLETVIAEVNKL